MLLWIIVLLILFGGLGGGYYGHSLYGPSGGFGIGLGTIVLLVLIVYLFGGLRN